MMKDLAKDGDPFKCTMSRTMRSKYGVVESKGKA